MEMQGTEGDQRGGEDGVEGVFLTDEFFPMYALKS